MSKQTVLSTFWVVLFTAFVLLAAIILLRPQLGSAQPGDEIGRYQISSWASYAGERVHHSGYYILDTTTGKVVDRGHEVHGIEGGSGR